MRAEPARTLRVGQEVVLLKGGLPGHYKTFVEQVDERAQKAFIRCRPREGFTYFFWYDLRDVVEVADGTDQ